MSRKFTSGEEREVDEYIEIEEENKNAEQIKDEEKQIDVKVGEPEPVVMGEV